MGVSLVVQRFQLMEPTFSNLPDLFFSLEQVRGNQARKQDTRMFRKQRKLVGHVGDSEQRNLRNRNMAE